jgi:hypothetical protein
MCHAYYAHHPSKHGFPEPGDERCNISDVEGLTSSVMAGLTTMDGLLCEPFLFICCADRWADAGGDSILDDFVRAAACGSSGAETVVG